MIRFTVKQVLAERNLPQRVLWEQGGIRQPTVSALCCGHLKHVPVEVLDRACKVLNCQPGDLFEYVPDDIGNDT